MKKKILLLSASVGAGHIRAAEAMETALRQLAPDADVRNVDLMQLTNPVFRYLYGQSYIDLVNRAPHMLGYFYDLLDRIPSRQQKSDHLRRFVEQQNLNKFFKLLDGETWDVVVCTHFLPAEMIAMRKREGRFAAPQAVVITDFDTHRLWANEPTERYFAATEEGAENLAYWGVARERISVSGIPVHPRFSAPKDRQAILKKFGLIGDRPLVLQMSGGFGVGPIEKIYRGILAIDTPLEVVVVAGRNAAVKSQLEMIAADKRHNARVIGFSHEIDDLMFVADVVVSKPGGLTTAETLASGAALAVVNPTPGQEIRNSDYLLERQAGMKINNLGTLAFKLGSLVRDPARLSLLKGNARSLGRPRAALEIAQFVLNMTT